MEVWLDVPNYEGSYQVSNFGKIKSLDRIIDDGKGGKRNHRGRILKNNLTEDGYNFVILRKNGRSKTILVHHLVYVSFVGEVKTGREINHINGIKTDNRLENLELVNRSENMRHAFNTGLSRKKLTRSEAEEIRNRYANGEKRKDLALVYGVSKQNIHKIINYQIWK